jgi:hypothetical protein
VVELRGFEPLTFSMPLRRATNCATAPGCDRSSTAYVSTVPGATRAVHVSASEFAASPDFTIPARYWVQLVLSRPTDMRGRALPRPALIVQGGGDEGTRTPDFRDANAALSQLSYIPMAGARVLEARR